MKIIFLDIDGVLVTRDSLTRWGQMQDKVRGYTMLDPAPIKLLNDIIEKTGAKIVISSSWRIGRTVEDLKKELKAGGLNTSTIIGMTPILHTGRGSEINAWIDDRYGFHPPIVIQFCIIDDDIFDMDPLKEEVVQTNMSGGLMEIHAQAVLKQLGYQDESK